MTPPKFLAIGFASITLIGTFLLKLPIATADGTSTPIVDALFTAVSAISVTGLTVVDTGTHWSIFGQIVMLMLVQLGGLGFMTSATWIALMFNRRISLRERMILQEAMGQYQIQGIVDLIRRVLVYTLIIEGAGALLLTLRFSAIMPLSDAAYFGIFQSISIFNNAGFDLFGQIHGPFSGFATYVADPFINIILMLLIFLGGVGFIVILILLNIRNARNCLFLQGCINRNVTINRNWGCHDLYSGAWQSQNIRAAFIPCKIMASLFQSITPRSGGVSTLDIASLEQSSQFFMILLMFIGALRINGRRN